MSNIPRDQRSKKKELGEVELGGLLTVSNLRCFLNLELSLMDMRTVAFSLFTAARVISN